MKEGRSKFFFTQCNVSLSDIRRLFALFAFEMVDVVVVVCFMDFVVVVVVAAAVIKLAGKTILSMIRANKLSDFPFHRKKSNQIESKSNSNNIENHNKIFTRL